MGEWERERVAVRGEVEGGSSREGMVLCCWGKEEVDAWNFEEVAACRRHAGGQCFCRGVVHVTCGEDVP